MWVYNSVLVWTRLGHRFFLIQVALLQGSIKKKWHNSITWDGSQRKYRKKELVSLLPVRDIQKDEAPYQLGLDWCSIPWAELPYIGLAHWRLARTSLSYLAFGMLGHPKNESIMVKKYLFMPSSNKSISEWRSFYFPRVFLTDNEKDHCLSHYYLFNSLNAQTIATDKYSCKKT